MKLKLLALLGLAGCILTGCGSKEQYFSDAEKAMQEGLYEQALDQYNKAIMEDEQLQLSYRGAGICCFMLKDYEKADDYFVRSLKQSDGIVGDTEMDLAYYRAENQICLGQDDEAASIYTEILDFDKKQTDARLYRGVIYARTGKLTEAKEDFAQAVKDQPDQVSLYYQIYQSLRPVDEEEAKRYLDQGLACEDVSMEGLYMKGCLYQAAGEADEALKMLEEAKKQGYAKAVFCMGTIYEEQGNASKALECYDEYMNLSNATLEEQIRILECRMATGDFETALKNCQTAIANSTDANLQQLLFTEVILYEQSGDFATARSKIEQYLASYPDDVKAQKEYTFLLTR